MRLLENKKKIKLINNPNYDHYAIESHQTGVKRELETNPKYRETAVPMDGISWGRDPRRQSFISVGFFLPLSLHGLLTPTTPCQYISEKEKKIIQKVSAVQTMLGTPAWIHAGGCPSPTAAVSREGHRACQGVTGHPELSPSQGNNPDLTEELLTLLQYNLSVLPTSTENLFFWEG